MSFGGSAAAMIQSNKANLSLRRGRNHLFDRQQKTSATNAVKRSFAPAPSHVRRRFREQLQAEVRQENLRMILLGLVVILAGLGVYFFV